ncbi:hypothetical protein P3W85_37315 [Cupriavidus basilensis]|uniref:Uncharacterized protein n=1 Tax=Cupriavidus basilensis TaxID=68895 RepID=A0ABT6B1F1_9BURK|nr:hypothetical protein [Cupriavidus basilensis]MDF3838554.1 hypothetical protein [Cupriavidus basilensis]
MPQALRAKALKENAEIAHEFGRCDLKCYREEYLDEEDEERHWLAETVTMWGDAEDCESSVQLTLTTGQFAVVFDLNCSLTSGKAAKTSLLKHAQELLDQQFARFEESLPTPQRPRIIKVRRNKLFHWLRLHDAIEFANADRDEVRKALYGDPVRWPERERSQKMREAMKKMSIDLKRAREMVDGGYLELVPLDSLQERSEERRTQRRKKSDESAAGEQEVRKAVARKASKR